SPGHPELPAHLQTHRNSCQPPAPMADPKCSPRAPQELSYPRRWQRHQTHGAEGPCRACATLGSSSVPPGLCDALRANPSVPPELCDTPGSPSVPPGLCDTLRASPSVPPGLCATPGSPSVPPGLKLRESMARSRGRPRRLPCDFDSPIITPN
uniref:Uncharacterized protein n=1 Tax=Zonotrichia albicollis TaxID=44394 RepID=A0A8D2N228_ZONAL